MSEAAIAFGRAGILSPLPRKDRPKGAVHIGTGRPSKDKTKPMDPAQFAQVVLTQAGVLTEGQTVKVRQEIRDGKPVQLVDVYGVDNSLVGTLNL